MTYANDPISIQGQGLAEAKRDLRRLGLSIRNTTSKPIYFVNVIVTLPETKTEQGLPYAFRLQFGRTELFGGLALPNGKDPAIKPGESALLRISPGDYANYVRHFAERGSAVPAVTHFEVWPHTVAFDGNQAYTANQYYGPGVIVGGGSTMCSGYCKRYGPWTITCCGNTMGDYSASYGSPSNPCATLMDIGSTTCSGGGNCIMRVPVECASLPARQDLRTVD
jgi:hypothetical protein